jgi:hypothetical protein
MEWVRQLFLSHDPRYARPRLTKPRTKYMAGLIDHEHELNVLGRCRT